MKQGNFLCAVLAATVLFACNQGAVERNDPQQTSSKLKIKIIDPEALTILDTTAVIEVIDSGFKWTEGPLYIADSNYLLFSDIPDNKIYKWKEGQKSVTYLMPSGNTGPPKPVKEPGSNGLTLDPDGRLVLCQHGDRRIARMTAAVNAPRPEFITLAGTYLSKRFNSPNDLVYHANGDLYFTDPPYGLGKGVEDSSKELDFQGVYRLRQDGRLDLFSKDLKYPNGLAFSPDGKSLFVASSDSLNYLWMKYELDSDGLQKSARVFYEVHEYEGKHLGAPDGMKVNKDGYLFATGPEGIWLFDPAGKLIARIYTGQLTSNCAFSPDQHTLYMTCDNYVMRLKLKKD